MLYACNHDTRKHVKLQLLYFIRACYVDLKSKDYLSNSNGLLSLSIPSQAMALANCKVAKDTIDKSKKMAHTTHQQPALHQLLLSLLPDKRGSLEIMFSRCLRYSCTKHVYLNFRVNFLDK